MSRLLPDAPDAPRRARAAMAVKLLPAAGLMTLGVLILALLALLAWPNPGRVTVTLVNVGNEPLRSAVVHVTGRSYAVGDIAAGGTTSVDVSATSDSHVELTSANGPRLIVDSYFGSGYQGTVSADVTRTRVVNVRSAVQLGSLY
jgi:hypothetical protein